MVSAITLRCATCGLPFAVVQDGAIVVRSKHHGEQHVNAVAIGRLIEVCQEDTRAKDNSRPIDGK